MWNIKEQTVPRERRKREGREKEREGESYIEDK